MKKSIFVLIIILFTFEVLAQAPAWKMVEGKISTPWAEKVDPSKTLPEYPRPQLVRNTWLNLNGPWDFAIADRDQNSVSSFQGKILVPFAIESALSGVGKNVGKENQLWYKRTFTIPQTFAGKTTLLHFGAVDWQCEVFVNGKKAGEHRGGYDPFSFDITSLLKKSGLQEVVVKVWDPSDDGPQPRGKQVKNPNSIWYTPVTGIWQTVWLEAVPKTYIQSTRQAPDIDRQTISISATIDNAQPGDKLKVSVFDGTQKI